MLKLIDSQEVLTNTLWILTYWTRYDDRIFQVIRDMGYLPRIKYALHSGIETMAKPALRVLGDLMAGPDEIGQVKVDIF